MPPIVSPHVGPVSRTALCLLAVVMGEHEVDPAAMYVYLTPEHGAGCIWGEGGALVGRVGHPCFTTFEGQNAKTYRIEHLRFLSPNCLLINKKCMTVTSR